MNSTVERSCEEFHQLNANLQTFVHELKSLDDQNRIYRENLVEVRREYFQEFEYHLKRLPRDFRQESEVLNAAHVERYRSKSRARRFLSEREEMKKRIQFLLQCERDQSKRVERARKYEEQMKHELKILNDQIEQLEQIVRNEKDLYEKTMKKLDDLFVEYEDKCVERSRTEFEIQTLREELKLLRTTKELVVEEEQNLFARQNDANEDFLSRLQQSIERLRKDFQQLNENQLKQIEENYREMIERVEKQLKPTEQIEENQWANLCRSEEENFKNLCEENHRLTDEILRLESDRFDLLNESERNLDEKNRLFIEYQRTFADLNDKFGQLAEYDRTLKFELTLYRNVLQGEQICAVPSKISVDQREMNTDELESTMKDLRLIYRDLATNDELIEINDDFPTNLIDRLEFGDEQIRKVFEEFVRKYFVQTSKNQIRPKTIDWIEFREILFPIITGRFLERHLRQLFDFIDRNKCGSLTNDEIQELLELLQIDKAKEISSTLNNSMTFDEFLRAMRTNSSFVENFLPDGIETQTWYIENPTEKFEDEAKLLGRIFKRMGIDIEQKQLDSEKNFLSMRLTNEFIHQNILIDSVDLESFIENFLAKKRRTDRHIKWAEFRDIFFPIVNGGRVSKDDLQRYFRIIDRDERDFLDDQQIRHLFRLLQISSVDEFLRSDRISSTFEDLLQFGEINDEFSLHLLPTSDSNENFNLDWLKKNTI